MAPISARNLSAMRIYRCYGALSGIDRYFDFSHFGMHYLVAGIIVAVLFGALATGLDALLDIRQHLLGEPRYPPSELPEDHPVRRKLEEEQ